MHLFKVRGEFDSIAISRWSILFNLSSPCFVLSVILGPFALFAATAVSSEQNPVIIIAVVAVAGTIILVFMVFGFIIGRR